MGLNETSKQEPHPIGSLVLVILGSAVMIGSLRYKFGTLDSPEAGFLPFFAGLAMAAFSSIPLLQSLKRGWVPLRDLWEGTQWPRAVIVSAGLILYSVFLRDLGFLLITMMFMVYLFRFLERSSWKLTLFVALTTTFGFYFVFQIWLEAQLPSGRLGF